VGLPSSSISSSSFSSTVGYAYSSGSATKGSYTTSGIYIGVCGLEMKSSIKGGMTVSISFSTIVSEMKCSYFSALFVGSIA